jgi:hypothetical protein
VDGLDRWEINNAIVRAPCPSHERRHSRVLVNFGSRRDQHSAAGSRVGDEGELSLATRRRLVAFQSTGVRSADHVDRERCE